MEMNRRSALKAAAMGFMAMAAAPITPASATAQGGLEFEVRRNSSKRFSWLLQAGNNRVIARSNGTFTTKSACLESIERIRMGAGSATIVDRT